MLAKSRDDMFLYVFKFSGIAVAEMPLFWDQCASKKGQFLNIGVLEGASTFLMAYASPESTIDAVDCYGLYREHGEPHDYSDRRAKFISHIAELDIKNVNVCLETSDQYFARTNKQYDVIFIDGNHSYEYVKRDLENAWARLKPDGILMMHDVFGEPGVTAAAFEKFCPQVEFQFAASLGVMKRKLT